MFLSSLNRCYVFPWQNACRNCSDCDDKCLCVSVALIFWLRKNNLSRKIEAFSGLSCFYCSRPFWKPAKNNVCARFIAINISCHLGSFICLNKLTLDRLFWKRAGLSFMFHNPKTLIFCSLKIKLQNAGNGWTHPHFPFLVLLEIEDIESYR